MKFARSNWVRPTKFLSVSHWALPFTLALSFSLWLVLSFATTAAAKSATEANHGSRTTLEASTQTVMPYVLAQSGGEAGRSQPLEPRYQPREPEPKSWYNGSYAFALTRSVADSTIAPAGQVPLYVLTVPLDIALLPFALIGGLFG